MKAASKLDILSHDVDSFVTISSIYNRQDLVRQATQAFSNGTGTRQWHIGYVQPFRLIAVRIHRGL